MFKEDEKRDKWCGRSERVPFFRSLACTPPSAVAMLSLAHLIAWGVTSFALHSKDHQKRPPHLSCWKNSRSQKHRTSTDSDAYQWWKDEGLSSPWFQCFLDLLLPLLVKALTKCFLYNFRSYCAIMYILFIIVKYFN